MISHFKLIHDTHTQGKWTAHAHTHRQGDKRTSHTRGGKRTTHTWGEASEPHTNGGASEPHTHTGRGANEPHTHGGRPVVRVHSDVGLILSVLVRRIHPSVAFTLRLIIVLPLYFKPARCLAAKHADDVFYFEHLLCG